MSTLGQFIAVANQKGGVAKTTTSINLAAALGVLEKRALVVDCDPQGNATRGLGQRAEAPNLYQVLSGSSSAKDAVRSTDFDGVELLPADRELVGAEVELADQPRWQTLLRRATRGLESDYDVIIFDCPPSLGHLTVSALVAADQVLVPLQCEFFALQGISELNDTVRRVGAGWNPGLAISRILLTMVDERTNLSQDVAADVRSHFGDRVFRTVIPRNVRLAEAPSHGVPIFQYDIKSRGAAAYLSVARELLNNEPS